jgi:carbon storage regulator
MEDFAMLVLSRKQGERLQIGDNVTVTVLEVHGRRVRFGIEAPSSTRILRGELTAWSSNPRAKGRERSAVLLAG